MDSKAEPANKTRGKSMDILIRVNINIWGLSLIRI